ncbi:MAG: hypothetical protein HY842_11850, partial [Bacteroidetes bacterium]|nr:hypothetical protein [Bacteroidota bacterium]
STKRYLGKDIFTHLMLPPAESDFKAAKEIEDALKYQQYEIGSQPVSVFDTVETMSGNTTIVETKVSIAGIDREPSHPEYKLEEGDFVVGVKLAFQKADTTFFAEPLVYLRGQMWGSLSVQLNDISMKVRLPEEALFRLLESEKDLNFQKFTFKTGDSIHLNGKKIIFAGVNKNPKVERLEGDVAVSAVLQVSDNQGKSYTAEPVFLIRKGEIITPKAEIPALGLHFFLAKIDPPTETFEVRIAEGNLNGVQALPVEIAKKSYRTDYIVLEAIVFPGINLFWLGSLLMMFGLAVAMFRRRKEKSGGGSPTTVGVGSGQ